MLGALTIMRHCSSVSKCSTGLERCGNCWTTCLDRHVCERVASAAPHRPAGCMRFVRRADIPKFKLQSTPLARPEFRATQPERLTILANNALCHAYSPIKAGLMLQLESVKNWRPTAARHEARCSQGVLCVSRRTWEYAYCCSLQPVRGSCQSRNSGPNCITS